MRSIFLLMLVAPLASGSAQTRRVPAQPSSPFQPGNFVVGPSTVIGNVGDASIAIGAELEYGLATKTSLGPGTIGLGFRAHTYSYDFDEYNGLFDASVRITPIAVAGNYHFRMSNPQLDPYVGLAIGYASASYNSNLGDDFTVNSGAYLMIDGGGRYYINPRTAIQAGLSIGSRGDVGLIRIAAMFQL